MRVRIETLRAGRQCIDSMGRRWIIVRRTRDSVHVRDLAGATSVFARCAEVDEVPPLDRELARIIARS